MWTRAQLKTAAKAELKVSYWLSFLVTLVAGIIAGAGSYASNSSNPSMRVYTEATQNYLSNPQSNYLDQFTAAAQQQAQNPMTMAAAIGTMVVSLLVLAYSLFVIIPVSVGEVNFFVKAPYGDRKFGNLFGMFKKGTYLKTIGTMFMVGLFTFLWSLLFIVPGIVKAYSYQMVPYIISENPNLTWREAMDLSKAMTKGHKWNIFVLDLSFLGWELLGVLTCGIGLFFLAPYISATRAQLYFALKGIYYGQQGEAAQAVEVNA